MHSKNKHIYFTLLISHYLHTHTYIMVNIFISWIRYFFLICNFECFLKIIKKFNYLNPRKRFLILLIFFPQNFLFNLYSWKNIWYRLKLLKYILIIIVKYHIKRFKPSTKKQKQKNKIAIINFIKLKTHTIKSMPYKE